MEISLQHPSSSKLSVIFQCETVGSMERVEFHYATNHTHSNCLIIILRFFYAGAMGQYLIFNNGENVDGLWHYAPWEHYPPLL